MHLTQIRISRSSSPQNLLGPNLLMGLRSPAMVALDFDKKQVLIGNTRYAGEIKKSVFTLMNYVLPKRNISFPSIALQT